MPTYEYQRILDDIAAQIRAGQLRPGDRLPSYEALASTYEVSKSTVRIALMLAAERGLVVGKPGKGTFVAEQGTTGQNV